MRQSFRSPFSPFPIPAKEKADAERSSLNSLTFGVERKGSTALVHCRGRLVAGLCGDFHVKIKPLFAENKRVVLDLTDLASSTAWGWAPWCASMSPEVGGLVPASSSI